MTPYLKQHLDTKVYKVEFNVKRLFINQLDTVNGKQSHKFILKLGYYIEELLVLKILN